jgi:hypothetical protein
VCKRILITEPMISLRRSGRKRESGGGRWRARIVRDEEGVLTLMMAGQPAAIAPTKGASAHCQG